MANQPTTRAYSNLNPEIQDANTRNIVLFNDLVQNDPEVENVLLPVRDGLMVIRKK